MSIFQFLRKGCPKSPFFQLFIKIIISPKILLYLNYYNYLDNNNKSIFFYFITKKNKKNKKNYQKIIKNAIHHPFLDIFINEKQEWRF
jgi:hypothetical protein